MSKQRRDERKEKIEQNKAKEDAVINKIDELYQQIKANKVLPTSYHITLTLFC